MFLEMPSAIYSAGQQCPCVHVLAEFTGPKQPLLHGHGAANTESVHSPPTATPEDAAVDDTNATADSTGGRHSSNSPEDGWEGGPGSDGDDESTLRPPPPPSRRLASADRSSSGSPDSGGSSDNDGVAKNSPSDGSDVSFDTTYILPVASEPNMPRGSRASMVRPGTDHVSPEHEGTVLNQWR